jgi:beta-phosphoglucomutase-like phosphatase (HAD superfamily)
LSPNQTICAVCFDYRGTLLDHNSDHDLVEGMKNLLSLLRDRKIPMALVSRFPKDELKNRLGTLEAYFGEHIYSGGGKAKLDCIRQFAEKLAIHDLSRIAFIDDKPDNFVPVAKGSDVFVIGFKGSGKYPHSEFVCKEQKITFAKTAKELENLLVV